MISENSTPSTQARAFSFFAFSGNLGIFLGSIIGTVSLFTSRTESHKSQEGDFRMQQSNIRACSET